MDEQFLVKSVRNGIIWTEGNKDEVADWIREWDQQYPEAPFDKFFAVVQRG